jgi:hypothetical protein
VAHEDVAEWMKQLTKWNNSFVFTLRINGRPIGAARNGVQHDAQRENATRISTGMQRIDGLSAD